MPSISRPNSAPLPCRNWKFTTKITTLSDGSRNRRRSVIVASRGQLPGRAAPAKSTYTGMGVSYCAVCDAAAFFGEAEIAVIGGGNTAVEEARFYPQGFVCSKVYWVHRRGSVPRRQDGCRSRPEQPKIVRHGLTVTGIHRGSDGVETSVHQRPGPSKKRGR